MFIILLEKMPSLNTEMLSDLAANALKSSARISVAKATVRAISIGCTPLTPISARAPEKKNVLPLFVIMRATMNDVATATNRPMDCIAMWRIMDLLMMGSCFDLGGTFMMPGSAFSRPNARAGNESVMRLSQRSWIAVKGAAMPGTSVFGTSESRKITRISPTLHERRNPTNFLMLE